MDTAAWIFLCLGIVLYLRTLRRPTNANRIALLVSVALLLTAKTQHIFAGLTLFVLLLVTRRQLGFTRIWLGGVAATVAVGIAVAYLGTPYGYASLQWFDIIFYEILPHSDDVHLALGELALADSSAA